MAIIITPQTGEAQRNIIENSGKINECYESQNGKCIHPNCKRAIHVVLNARSAFTGEQRFIGLCEKHYEENTRPEVNPKRLLGIKNP